MSPPFVSVIIPTHDRSALIGRAVESALAQYECDLEVIVVIDGPDDATVQAIAAVGDARVTTLTLSSNRGVACALNAGIHAARGNWVAILADDDEWLPSKLALQLEAATNSRFAFPLISCRLIARFDMGDLIWPRQLLGDREPLSEYLFCQRGVRSGEKLLAPSTFLAPTELFRRVPFTEGLRRNEDADWLLRANQLEGFGIEFVRTHQPLLIYHCESTLNKSSLAGEWHYLLEWARAVRDRLTPRAYAAFILRIVSNSAARKKDWAAFLGLPLEAFRGGKPDGFDLLAHLALWLIPFEQRLQLNRLADRLTRQFLRADA